MKISKEQFCNAINTYKEMYEEEVKLSTTFDIAPEWICGKWINNYFNLLIELSSESLEEKERFSDLISWFCFETDFGSYNYGIYDEDGVIICRIENAENLYDYLVGGK